LAGAPTQISLEELTAGLVLREGRGRKMGGKDKGGEKRGESKGGEGT